MIVQEFHRLNIPLQEKIGLFETVFGDPSAGRSFGLVSGIHGDELDGLYLAYRLTRFLKEWEESGHSIRGRVTLIPMANPLAVASTERVWPFGTIDLNRCFTKDAKVVGAPWLWAQAILDRLDGFDLVMDVHSSNMFLYECPQMRVMEKFRSVADEFGVHSNVDILWVHDAPTVLETTLSYNLNIKGVPTLVLELGVAHRITTHYADTAFDGILNLLQKLGILDGALQREINRCPIMATDKNVWYLNSESGGFFLPSVLVGQSVRKNEEIGAILNALTGEIKETLVSPCAGFLFTLRAHPIVFPGNLMARIVEI